MWAGAERSIVDRRTVDPVVVGTVRATGTPWRRGLVARIVVSGSWRHFFCCELWVTA